MSEEKTYTLEQIEAVDSPALDAETANTYSVEDLDRMDSWSSGKNALTQAVTSYGKGFAADVVRIPGEIGLLIKETGEKGGAGMAIPSFNDGVNIARKLTGKEIERGKLDDIFIGIGEKMSNKNKEFLGRLNLKPEEGSKLSQLAFDLGSGTASVATSLGLLYATKSPTLLAALFGGRQKAQIYEEASTAGMDVEDSSMLSSVAGLVEGGIEAIGGIGYLKSVSFNKFLTRALVRTAEQGLEEGLQQTGEEALMKVSGVRKDSMRDMAAKVAYAASLGMILGAPASVITSSLEKTGIKKDLRGLGLTHEQATRVMERITEKTIEDQTVHQEIIQFLEEELKNTEASVNENPNYSPAEETKEETKEEDLEQEKKALEKEAEIKEEKKTEEAGELEQIKEPDTSFNVDEFESKYEPYIDEKALKATEADAEKTFIEEQLSFRKNVGKFKKFKNKFMLEEMAVIPKSYITTENTAPDIDERAEQMGFESGEALRKAIVAFESYRPGAKKKLQEIKKFLREYGAATKKSDKELQVYTSKIEKILSENIPSKDVKKIVRAKTGQVQVAPKKVSEMQALKASLNAQVRAAFQSKLDTKKELSALKKGLVDTVKQYIPPSNQGKFLGMIASADNGRAILSVSNRIETLADEIQRKTLVRAIKNQAKRFNASKQIAIDYVQRINSLLDKFDLQGRQEDTITELKATQDFIDQQRKAGNDVSLPQYVLNRLKILGRQPIDKINTATLQNILTDIQTLADMGKTKLRASESAEEALKNRYIQELQAGSKKLENKEIVIPRVGEELDPEQARKNILAKTINAAQSMNFAITPMDVVFDVLDGNKGYTGPNYRIFKNNIDQSYSEYLNKKDSILKDILTLSEQLGLRDSNLERIGFYAAKVQEGGAEKLESLGYSQQEIESLKLSETEEKLYNSMRRALDALRPEIAEVMRTVYNQELGTVTNYFPFITDFEAMSDFEIRERFGNSVQEFGQAPRKNVQKGFTLKRVGGSQKIKLHAMQIFLQHIDNAAYLITVGSQTKRLGEIAKSTDYLNAVGDKGQEIVVDWVDTIARKGKMAGDRFNALDVIRKNVGMATLGFKLSSVLLQPTAFMDGASLIGSNAFIGAKEIATSQEWRQFVSEHMPEIRARIGDDPAYMDFGSQSLIDKTGRTAFWALQKLDAITASAVAAGAYIKYMNEKGLDIDFSQPNQEGINYAQQIVRRTQASSFFKDAPQALTRGKLTGLRSLDRLLLQFQTFMLNRWSLIQHDGFALGFKAGNINQGVNVMSFLVLAAIAETGMRGLSKELIDALIPGDDSDDKDGFVEESLVNILEMVPVVSQLVSAFTYGSMPIPSVQLGQKTVEKMQAAAKSKNTDTKIKNSMRALLLSSGILGMPGTVQADQLIGKVNNKKSSGRTRL